ncbi:MAG TPA: 6-bladed beta-propeller [Longimicrobium sp.]|uniref:6-bladed beta-propeller n=1 Tax=Longimicrobium sp. TaxID=2029185 RepID=UPI002EDABD03
MRHTGITIAAPLLALALLAADAGAQGRIVQLPRADRALAGAPAAVYTIGAAEGAEEETFGTIAGVGFDAAENLYVLDQQNARVMVYGPNGRFLRRIGKKGQGPGELMIPTQIAVAPDGTVTINDMATQRLNVFRPDGTFVRTLQTPGVTTGGPLAWHPRGFLGAFRPMMSREGNFSQTSTSVPLLLYPAAGGEPAKVFDVPQTISVQQTSGGPAAAQTTRLRVSGPAAFSPAVLYGVLPTGQVALSFTSGYTVRVIDTKGQTLRYLQRPLPVRLTTEADRERARAQRREMFRTGRGMVRIVTGGGGGAAPPPPSAAELEARMGEMRFADTIAALRGLRTSPSGKIWVERTGRLVGEPGPLDLITPEGQYLGTTTAMQLPGAISRGGLAAFITRDEDDVEQVVVKRLPAGWR